MVRSDYTNTHALEQFLFSIAESIDLNRAVRISDPSTRQEVSVLARLLLSMCAESRRRARRRPPLYVDLGPARVFRLDLL